MTRALEDICRTTPGRQLEEIVDRALFRKATSVDDLAASCKRLAKLAAARSRPGEIESVLETRFLRIVRASGLPPPVPQHEIRRGGVLVARVDFAYPAERIAIEIEGYEFHSGRRAFDRGHARFRELQGAGYLVVPFTSTDLRRPKQVDGTLRRVLWERGHPDVVSL